MATILVVLFFFILIGYIGFLTQPKEAEKAFNKPVSRKQISLYFVPVIIALLIGIGIVGADSQQSENTDTTTQSSEQQNLATEPVNSSGEMFGLSEDTRKQVCYDIAAAQDRAMDEADAKYPIDIFENPNAQDNVEANIKLNRELSDKYEAEVRSEYDIDYETQSAIVSECVQNDWPLPEIE